VARRGRDRRADLVFSGFCARDLGMGLASNRLERNEEAGGKPPVAFLPGEQSRQFLADHRSGLSACDGLLFDVGYQPGGSLQMRPTIEYPAVRDRQQWRLLCGH